MLSKFVYFLLFAVTLNIGMDSRRVEASPVDGEPSVEIVALVKKHFSNVLKDPDGALYRWPTWLKSRDETTYCFWMNAKNSYGGYVGYKLYAVLLSIKEDKIIGHTIVEDGNKTNPQMAKEFCSYFGYDISGPPVG